MANKLSTASETGHDTPSVSRRGSPLGKTLLMGGAFWMGLTALEGGVGIANNYLQETQTEMRAADSRDAVIRVLTDINKEKREPVKELMKGSVSVSKNTRTETVGNHVLKINRNSVGYVIGIGPRAFFVGQTEAELEQALNKARNAVLTISDARTGLQSAMAFGSQK